MLPTDNYYDEIRGVSRFGPDSSVWHLLTNRETSFSGLGMVTEWRNRRPSIILCLQSSNAGPGRALYLLSRLLVMRAHSVKMSPEQLVELLWSECIGGKQSAYLHQISTCSRSDYFFFVTGPKRKNLCRRISEGGVSFVLITELTRHRLLKM